MGRHDWYPVAGERGFADHAGDPQCRLDLRYSNLAVVSPVLHSSFCIRFDRLNNRT